MFLLLLTLMNTALFDETLQPGAKKALSAVSMPNPEDNAYFAIWGLPAASDKNMLESGREIIQRYRFNLSQNIPQLLSDNDYQQIWGGKEFDQNWQELIKSCNPRTHYGCLSEVATQLKNTPINDARLAVISKRYETIINLPRYTTINDVSLSTPLPVYSSLIKFNQLKLAELYNANQELLFIQHIDANLRFWKMVLAEENSLIDKMVAVANIWTDIQYLSEYIKSSTLSAEAESILQKMLIPLTQKQLDLTPAFYFEQKVMYNSIKNITPEQLEDHFALGALPVHWLIQPNATINDYFEHFVQPLNHLNQMSPVEFSKTIHATKEGEFTCCFTELDSLVTLSPTSLYNLGGKLMLSTAIFSAEDYIARVHDLNGMIQLVKLQLSLRSIDDSQLAQSIQNSALRNPYTKAPMDFESGEKWLGFGCLNKSSKCQIQL